MDDHTLIRPLETLEEFQACHAVQREAWSFPDLLIIPYRQLVTFQHHGGVVLGAFDGPTLVGFAAGYLGRQPGGALYLFSQRAGVLPAYQGRGIGERLKWAQRAWALGQNLDRIVWTYDPLQAPNARLNIGKLSGVVRQYECDAYGGQSTAPGSHLPSDRFLLEWELSSERVLARLSHGWSSPAVADLLAQAGPPVNAVSLGEGDLPRSGLPDLGKVGQALLVEVPADWQTLCHADAKLATEWRATTRRIFEHYLGQGYVVTNFSSGWEAGRRRNFYLLERASIAEGWR